MPCVGLHTQAKRSWHATVIRNRLHTQAKEAVSPSPAATI